MTCHSHTLAEQLTMAGPSALVMLSLFLLVAIAGCTFFALVWRETSARRAVALEEWAQATGFYFNPLAKLRTPHPLERFGAGVRVKHCLVSISTKASVVEFLASGTPATSATPPGTAGSDEPDPHAVPVPPPRYHVLIWPVESDWPAIALRPVAATTVLSDVLPLPSQATRYGSQRFVIHTDHRVTAKNLADSRVRGLLPADIGLILIGRFMLLDFSCRPFDGIEFNRMIAIAQQVLAHLPAAK